MRPRSQTIGTLGRAPARVSKPPNTIPNPVVTPPPPPPERGVLRRWLRGAMFDNLGLKFLSMVLAVTVFLLVNTDKDRETNLLVGVSYTLPEDKVLVSDRIDDVRVTVRGSGRRLRKFDQSQIDRIHLDLRHASSGEIPISNDMLHLPSGLTITSISPRYVHVRFDRRIDKLVEVMPTINGRPQHGYIVSEITPVPATVRLRGGEVTLARLTTVHTGEISLEGRTDTFVAETDVVPPDGAEVAGNPKILVQIRIEEELATRKLPGLPVAIRGDGDLTRWTVSPAQVDVTLTGTVLGIEKARGTLVPVVKLPSDQRAREVEITVEGLPPGIGVKLSPEHARLVPARPPVAPLPPRSP